jgi:long-chain acyl-CoA synthetase
MSKNLRDTTSPGQAAAIPAGSQPIGAARPPPTLTLLEASGALATLPQYFLRRVATSRKDKIAVRQKVLGIWQEYTWQDAYMNVHDFTLGLITLGLEHGQRVGVVGDNDRYYLWADFAIMAAGGVTIGLFTDANPGEIAYIVSHSEAFILLAKDQEQCDKLLEIKDQIPLVRQVIYWEPRGMWYYEDPWLMSFEEVQARGRQLAEERPGLFEELVACGKGEDFANFCYTSGTTGTPKGAMLTHANFIQASLSFEATDPRYDTDNLLSFLPLAWIAEHSLAVTPHAIFGLILNFPEAPETVRENIREIAPQIVFYPARLWENLTATIQMRINDTTWINRKLYQFFLPVGYKIADKHYRKESPGLLLRLGYWLGDRLVFAPLRNQLGLTKVRTAITAGAALSPDVFRFFRALGINLKQVFASTETSAVGTMHRDDDVRFATVGLPAGDLKMKITSEGEICLGGGHIFAGYFKDEVATARALEVDPEGIRWFHTGDAGYIDENGHLIYLDRLKDMIELANGERFSPQFIEGRYKFSPYIRDAMALGDSDQEYVAALISIDFENVGRWAEKRGIPYTTYQDLSQKPEVYQLILQDVCEVNRTLPAGGQVRRFVLMHKEFDADEAEMTRTRKLRRGFLRNRYQEIINAIYAGEETVRLSMVVRYQDNREGVVETDVRIMSVEEAAL